MLRLSANSESIVKSEDCQKILSEFVIKIYARVWFAIKCKPSCKAMMWKIVYFSRDTFQKVTVVFDSIIHRNAIFCPFGKPAGCHCNIRSKTHPRVGIVS